MPYQVKDTITGLDDLFARLKAIPKKLQNKALKDGVGKAGKEILWKAKGKAPRKSGLLRKSLGRKVKVYRNSGAAVAIVGPRKGFKGLAERGGREVMSDPVRYAHLVELGTVRTDAQAFLVPAFRESKDRAQELIAEAVRKQLGEL